MAPKLLNILLQRNDSNVQWGFRLSGGKDLAKPLTIVKVFPGTLSAQYLVPGDIVLNIQGYEAKSLLHVEAVELVRDPGKSLELVIQKTDTPLSSNEDLPASIWGPEPVLQRPSEWLRRSPSPFMNQCFQPISPKPSVYQRSVSVGSGYTEPSGSTRPMSPVLLRPSDWLRQSPTNHPTVFSEPTSPTEPIIQAPSAWMKRAPSPSPAVFSEHKPTGYRNANSLRQHFEAVNQDAMQQESNLRTGYTPMSLDNKIRQRFESLEVEPGFQKLKSDVTVTEENFRPLFNPPSKKWRAPSEPYQKPFEAQKIYDDSNVSYFSETKTYQDGKLHTKISNDVHKPQENVNIYSRLSPTPIQEIIGPNRHQIQVQYEVQFGIQKQTPERFYEQEIYLQQQRQKEIEKEFQLKQQQIQQQQQELLYQQKQQQIQKQQQELLYQQKQQQLKQQQLLLQQQQQQQQKQLQEQKLLQEQQQMQHLQQLQQQKIQQNKSETHYQKEESKGQLHKTNTGSTTIFKSSREQFSASTIEVNKNMSSTEKSKIPTTADILKRPISPEFNMVPNSRSSSLLKHVLSKSLGSYSPADFEKMKAYENEQSDNDDDEDDDSSTETDDDDEDESTEEETEVETQDDDACSSCQPSIYDSGSVIFERFWGSENEDNDCADDNEVMQHYENSPYVELSTDTSCSTVASASSISRNSSSSSNYSRPDTPIVTEEIVDEYDRLRRSASNISSRPGTPVAQQSQRSSRCSSVASVDSRPGTPYTQLSRSSSASSVHSRPRTPIVPDNSRGRQSSQISGGGNTPSPGPPSEGDGVTNNSAPPIFAAPPPPPPPPPPASGPLPSVRLNTEIPDSKKGGGYEPPAAIQNAMMTKDKKPFTYTPGGLDLSQIRSPRMQRRITRNANAEGVGEHPQAAVAKTSPLAQPPPQGPLPPSALAAMQPQMAVPVFPTGGVPQLHHVTTPPGSHNAPAPPPPPPPPSGPVFPEPPSIPQPPISNAVPKITPPVIRPVQSPAPPPKVEPSIPTPTVVKSQPMSSPTTIYNEPGSIYVPPVTTRAQVGSLYIPPLTNNTQQESVTSPPLRQQTPQTASPMSPLPTLNKAPTPWMSQHQRQQQQQSVPSWVNREDSQQQQQQPAGTTRIIPIQVEGRNDSVQPPQAHYQAPVSVPQYQPPQPASNQPHTRIIPIQIEGSGTNNAPKQQSPSQQQQQQQRMPVYVHNKFNPSNSPQTPPSPAPYNHSVGNDSQSEQNPRQYQQQQSWGPTGGNGGQQNWGPPGGNGGPIQSRSFRVLQKITDTDQSEGESDVPAQEYGPPSSGGNQWNNQGIPVQQMRKLQLSEDDRALMNKFRAQVDEDSFLHTESDPRYRGAAIPSRAFRMLQNMTDGTGDYSEQVPRGPAVSRGPQTRPVQQSSSVDGATPQPYIPPSEQQVPEPRKYTGGAIPSRSFRMLQAMTAPENCGPGQSDM